MPYFYYESSPMACSSYSLTETASVITNPNLPEYGQLNCSSTLRGPIVIPDVPKQQESRTGTNLSHSGDTGKLVRSKPYLVTYKKFAGYEVVSYRKKVWRKNRKGEYRPFFEVIEKRKKKFLTMVDVRYREFTIKKGVYLKPNDLQYYRALRDIFPMNIMSEIIWNTSRGGYNSIRSQSIGMFSHHDPQWFPSHTSPTVSVTEYPFGLPPHGLNINVPELADRALIKLYNKVLDETPNYYTTLAETGELINTLRSIMLRGFDLIKSIYRLDVKRLKGALKGVTPADLSNTWLTWIYGIAPVIQDIEGSIELAMREDRVWRSYSAMARTVDREEIISSPILNGSVKYNGFTFYRYGVVLDGQMSITRYLQRAQHWQQTAATVYEVIPFSFMLDWLVDISGYLNGVNVMDGRIIDSWETRGQIMSELHIGKPKVDDVLLTPSAKPVVLLSKQEIDYDKVAVWVYRTNLNGSLPPMPKPIVPTSGQLLDGISWSRAINAFAILISRERGLKDRWSRELKSDRRKINLGRTVL